VEKPKDVSEKKKGLSVKGFFVILFVAVGLLQGGFSGGLGGLIGGVLLGTILEWVLTPPKKAEKEKPKQS